MAKKESYVTWSFCWYLQRSLLLYTSLHCWTLRFQNSFQLASHGLYPPEPSKLKVYLLKEILFHHYFLQRFLLFYFTPDKFHSEEKIIMTDMSREGLFGCIKDTAWCFHKITVYNRSSPILAFSRCFVLKGSIRACLWKVKHLIIDHLQFTLLFTCDYLFLSSL